VPSVLKKEEDSDLVLVQALQDGKDRAMDDLMNRHREGLFRFVLRYVRNETDALELTMETFVRAYFSIGKFKPRARFATWLYQIALNLCRDHLRSRAYRYSQQTVSFDAPEEDNQDPGALLASERTPDKTTDRREELLALEQAINELPEELKNVFILTALEERQQLDVAELLGTSCRLNQQLFSGIRTK
jgi:RNA polymerase sigma factor (sigma-70 family)